MISLLLSAIFWILKSLVVSFVLLILLELCWRSYRIFYGAKRAINPKDAILITGATSGIGLALAKHLFTVGYSVIIGYYDSNEPGYKQLKQMYSEHEQRKKSYESSLQRMIFIELDVTSQASITQAYLVCKEALKENKLQLYGLVNNAGLGSLQPFCFLQRARIRNLIETNLLGCLLMSREFLPLLVKSRGRILNVSSGLGFVPGPTYATYGITKSAQLYFTRCMNFELKKSFGVKSIAVIPHNFIKNTNICSMNVKQNEAAWLELKEEERQLYNEEFKQHCKLAQELELATKEISLRNQQQQQNKKSLSPPKQRQTQQQQQETNFLSKVIELAKLIVDVLKGVNSASSLEESGVLECFEAALRLKNPPECMFAGDKVYQTLAAAVLLCSPSSFTKLLSSSVSQNMYR